MTRLVFVSAVVLIYLFDVKNMRNPTIRDEVFHNVCHLTPVYEDLTQNIKIRASVRPAPPLVP